MPPSDTKSVLRSLFCHGIMYSATEIMPLLFQGAFILSVYCEVVIGSRKAIIEIKAFSFRLNAFSISKDSPSPSAQLTPRLP